MHCQNRAGMAVRRFDSAHKLLARLNCAKAKIIYGIAIVEKMQIKVA